MSKQHYKRMDVIRVVSCIAILLYHLGLLKGGYLAVCTFFVLSGYLSVSSIFSKDKFSFKKYYLNKLKKIYLPLLLVTFISIAIISLIPSITWLNLKPEANSVLFGYNNFWQLNANLDYFVRHVSSPFMHLWYIAILLQFELVFPFIFLGLKKLGEKTSKFIPCIILFIGGIVSYIFFYKVVKNGNLMTAYYGTFYRSFSLLFGMLLGFIHHYYKPIIIKDRAFGTILFVLYLIILIVSFFVVGVTSKAFNLSMLIISLLTMRLIDYSIINTKHKIIGEEGISFLSKITYEIYLVQYPVIFLFQYIHINNVLKIISIILITLIISCILKMSTSFKKFNIIKIIVMLAVFSSSIFGLYKYIVTKDHTNEMKKLEQDLSNNQKLIAEKRKKFEENRKNEEDEWQKVLNDFEASENELREAVRKLKVVGIGDSIMELAVKDLYNQFPNGYFDAVVNRTDRHVNEILVDLKNKNLLGDIVIFNIGTNGEWSWKNKEEIMKTLGDRKVFWLNATNADYDTYNSNLDKFAQQYSNIHIIDWVSVAKAHPEYLISDKVHPTVRGCKVYAEVIFNAVYDEYIKDFKVKKEQKMKEHEALENSKVTFLGNDLLVGAYNYLQGEFENSEFIIDEDFTYKKLENKINTLIKDNTLAKNVVFMFDSNFNITEEQYNKLIELCEGHNIYIIDVSDKLKFNNSKANIIDFESKIRLNKKYITADSIHLTESGNKELSKEIKDNIKNSKE